MPGHRLSNRYRIGTFDRTEIGMRAQKMFRQALDTQCNEREPGENGIDQVTTQSSITWRELALKTSRSGLELGSYP